MSTMQPRPEVPAKGPHTWADFIELASDDTRELVDGELLELEMPGEKHERIVGMLCHLLNTWALGTRAGRVLASGYKVKVDDRRGFMPDVQVYLKGNTPPAKALDRGRPDLAIEVISAGRARFDRVLKLTSYAAIGVPEYWIVDPDDETVTVHVLGSDRRYTIAAALDREATLRSPTLEGLELAVASLFDAPDEE